MSQDSTPLPTEAETRDSTALMFMMVIGMVVVFLAVYYYLPARSGQPVDEFGRPTPTSAGAGSAEAERMRQDMIDSFGKSIEGLSSPEDIQRMVEGQMKNLANDPRFSPEERAAMQQKFQEAARKAGAGS